MVSPSAKGLRWARIAAGVAGLFLCLFTLAAAFWPALLEGTAREKALSALRGKFDLVEMGCFELQRDTLHVCDLRLEKGDVLAELTDVYVDFEVRWWERKVVVDGVFSEGGDVTGTPDGFRGLRGGKQPTQGSSSGSLELSDASVRVESLGMHLDHEGATAEGVVALSAENLSGPFELELTDVVAERGALWVSAERLTAEVDPGNLYPLHVDMTSAAGSFEDFEVGGVSGSLALEDQAFEKVRLELHGQLAEGQPWTLEGELERAGKIDVLFGARGLSPSQLPVALPVRQDEGSVSGSLALAGTRQAVHVEGSLELDGVVVEHPKLAREGVVLRHRLRGVADLNLEERELRLESGSVAPLEDAGWALKMSGRALYAEDSQHELEAAVRLDSAPCQELLEAVPEGLAPALQGFELGGEASVDVTLVAKRSDPDATVFRGGINLDSCELKKVPPTVADMTGPFSHVVKMKTGQTVSRLLGRGGLYYTPHDKMPKHLPGAVLSTEDGAFWRHDGFRGRQFEASLRRNIELGEFRRGASTITMQMVKNVLLTQEKTLARKFQELFLTWVVEEHLGKRRILEIYLNAVEFGPGVYGVGDAADHYFGKTPFELTSLESAFLATLLPRPVERHEMWCRGALTKKHASYLSRVHRRMLATHRVTQAEFDAAEEEGIVFSRRGWQGESLCLAAGQRVRRGKHVQGALSGLLLGRPDEG